MPAVERQTVRALRPLSRARQRTERVREQLRERFWVVPGVMMALGAVLAVVTAAATRVTWFDTWPAGLAVNASSTQAILSLIATSTLTFVGVVFTITLVALQLASSQASPRVVRTFVRSLVTRATFGLFLATFTFSVVVLALEGPLESQQAQSRAVTAALVLVLMSLALFVVYVTQTMRLLQVSWVISEVARETRRSIAEAFPPDSAYLGVAAPDLSGPGAPEPLGTYAGDGTLLDSRTGFLTEIDRSALVALAAAHDCVIALVRPVGDYLPTYDPVYVVHGRAAPPRAAVDACLRRGRARTLLQDPTFGFRQIVDIAIQALSPALNQPTTAVQAIDRLEDLLLRLAHLPDRTGLWVDDAETVRLMEPVDGWDYLLEVAFGEITSYGASSVAVTRRLLATYDALLGATSGDRRRAVEERQAELVAFASGNLTPEQRRIALDPDGRGLG